MAELIEQNWIPADGSGLSRKDKQGGVFHAFVPDTPLGEGIYVDRAVALRAARVERALVRLNSARDSGQLEGIARLLMRSEAVSSSRIEGIAPRVDKVLLAELSQHENVRGFKESAEAVARNLEVMRSVERVFGEDREITVGMLEDFQCQLLGEGSVPTGLRKVQNWIGGSSRTPIGADFIPAPPREVVPLMEDLVSYLNGATHGPLIQAALVHAQFETIHPFADGNGRVGRALIHGVLMRRGLARRIVLPISLVLGTWSHRYVDGLTAFREGNVNGWLELFVEAAEEAVEQSELLAQRFDEVKAGWAVALEEFRTRQGKTRALRSDSIEAKLIEGLPAHPIMTVASAQRLYGSSAANARHALDSLTSAGLLRTKVIGAKGALGYYADDILDLITHADRQLASSAFDTRVSAPTGRAVPSDAGHR